jgi:hypothetical protein
VAEYKQGGGAPSIGLFKKEVLINIIDAKKILTKIGFTEDFRAYIEEDKKKEGKEISPEVEKNLSMSVLRHVNFEDDATLEIKNMGDPKFIANLINFFSGTGLSFDKIGQRQKKFAVKTLKFKGDVSFAWVHTKPWPDFVHTDGTLIVGQEQIDGNDDAMNILEHHKRKGFIKDYKIVG